MKRLARRSVLLVLATCVFASTTAPSAQADAMQCKPGYPRWEGWEVCLEVRGPGVEVDWIRLGVKPRYDWAWVWGHHEVLGKLENGKEFRANFPGDSDPRTHVNAGNRQWSNNGGVTWGDWVFLRGQRFAANSYLYATFWDGGNHPYTWRGYTWVRITR